MAKNVYLKQAVNLRLDADVGGRKKGEVLELKPGWNSIPDELVDHWYIRAQSDETKAAPPLPAAEPEPLGAATLKDPVEIGNEAVPLQTFTMQAMVKTGLKPSAWNQTNEETRDMLISAEIASAREQVDKKGGRGKKD